MFRPVRIALVAATAALGLTVPVTSALAADTASINGATTHQSIAGFGIAEAFGQALNVMNASSAEQQQTFDLLFNTSSGAGLDIIRNWIGAGSGSTIEPNSPASPSATPSYVSLASINSDNGQLWFDQRARTDYGVTNIFADAWSAPAFMKTNDSADNGGTLCGVPGASCSSGDWRQAYANYLVQYASDYSAAGVPLTYVGPENEATLSTSYDSMQMTSAQTVSFLDVLGPTLKSSGLSTQMECCASLGWNVAQTDAAAIEADPTALADTAVFGSHGYSGAPTSPLSGWTKPAWETEWFGNDSSAWDPAWDDGTADSGFTWAQHIYQGLTGANLSAFLFWEGADANNGNGGLVYLNNGTATASGRLWAFANYSRFIRPGAVRIGATSSNSAVELSAYKNTDGTVSIVALNTGTSSDPITYSLSGTGTPNGATVTPYLTSASSDTAAQATTNVGNGAFSATIPARSLVTYVIGTSSTSTGNTVTVTGPGNQTGTAGTAASLQISASDSAAGQTLSYAANGLPAGLSINSATGLISGTPTTAGTSTVTVTATDSTGASGAATFTWTISSATTSGATCQVSYTTTSQWAGGFVAGITITNTGSTAVSGWKLTFTFGGDQQITTAWNGSASQSGENVTVANASYNGTIAAGGNTSVGFQGTWTASDSPPASFALNGTTCTG